MWDDFLTQQEGEDNLDQVCFLNERLIEPQLKPIQT